MKKSARGILAAALAVGALALVVGAAAGGESDPLVTKSYLDEVAAPAILEQVEERLEEREDALVDELSGVAEDYRAEVEELLAEAGGTVSGGEGSSVFTAVTVPAGQSLIGTAGCEVLLRSGAAACVAESAPGLIDTTGGTTLASGEALQPNHLYLITADGWGLSASADATVLVRGSCTVG